MTVRAILMRTQWWWGSHVRWSRSCSLLFAAVAAVALLSSGCARLPAISPTGPDRRAGFAKRCQHPFVQAPWRFVHAISAEMTDRRIHQLIGVSALDPPRGTLEAVLMTVEGLVIFEAHWDGDLRVSRALPPFDKQALAIGLLDDIMLLFFAPEGPPAAVGLTDAGLPVCRYRQADGSTLDVVQDADDGWEIHLYNPQGKRVRAIVASAGGPADSATGGFRAPRRMELTAAGRRPYRLILDLVSEESIDSRNAPHSGKPEKP